LPFQGGPKGGLKQVGPKVGEAGPDFELKFLAEEKKFKLSDNFGRRPTVLIFRAPTNDRRDLPAEQEPKTLADREKWACADRQKMKYTIPVVMDTMDDKTMKAYDAFPQRVFVLGKDGTVVYCSSGLVGFAAEDVGKVLKSLPPGK
jgi:hypothetical protein